MFAYQEKEGSDEYPTRFEEEKKLGTPWGTVADHIDDVLAKLVHS